MYHINWLAKISEPSTYRQVLAHPWWSIYIFLVSAIQKTPTIFRKKKHPICPNLSNLKIVARIREETNDTNSPTQIFRSRKINECPFFKGRKFLLRFFDRQELPVPGIFRWSIFQGSIFDPLWTYEAPTGIFFHGNPSGASYPPQSYRFPKK